mmetsp:Transcript_6423/g.13885  ORF Transcript_6423/g.13885 Transcript_6423/m.13885 type:complete len:153 (-) Transcript_6423:111-569(-)
MVRQKSRHFLVRFESPNQDISPSAAEDLVHENLRNCLLCNFGNWTSVVMDKPSNRNGADVRSIKVKHNCQNRSVRMIVTVPREFGDLVRCALTILSPLDLSLIRKKHQGVSVSSKRVWMHCNINIISVHGLAGLAERTEESNVARQLDQKIR